VKKLLLFLMTAMMLVLPLHSAALDGPEQPEAPETVKTAYQPGDTPAQTCAVDSASPLLHAVLLALLNQDAAAFDAGDPVLAWESLYNMLSLYGQLDDRSRYEGDFLVLPAETVRDYAASLSPSLSGLGEPPEDLSDRLTYRASDDSYLVACGEEGMLQLCLSSPVRDGSELRLTGELVSAFDDTVLASFRAVLLPGDNLLGTILGSMELL